MSQKTVPARRALEVVVHDIRQATRRRFVPEEIIRIVLDGLRGEESIARICRRARIASSIYDRCYKNFFAAAK